MDQNSFTILKDLEANLSKAILGNSDQIKLILTALLANGHVLIEGVPGTGKTRLIKALAHSIQSQFRRVQCNPDLLPTDITGFSIYHPKKEKFVYQPGPVMSHFLLVDEINRASTKTQSALLEAMEEKQVTVDGKVYPLPHPFFVMATQNPIEFEGTYIPEAQLDRFMIKLPLGYPTKQTEKELIHTQTERDTLDDLTIVTNMDEILMIQQTINHVFISHEIVDYILAIVERTRNHPLFFLGISPRGTLAFVRAAKALALIHERDFVTPDDVKFLIPYVFHHRIILQGEAQISGETVDSLMNAIVEEVDVPIRMEK